MQLVSCRKDFYATSDLGPLTESSDSGAKVVPCKLGPATGGLILVHGYNNRFEDVRNAYGAIQERVREVNASRSPCVEGFLWPGLGDSWTDALQFRRAQGHADAAAVSLAQYLKGAPEVSIMTHSLGARVALEAIKIAKTPVKKVFLTGPAIDNEHLRTKYAEAVQFCEEIHVFWSRNDNVLARAYELSQFDRALGRYGPDKPVDKVISHDRSDFVKDHGDYRHDPVLYRTM